MDHAIADPLQSTLKFINEDASSVHGCVRASSIFTSEGGEWKLGGFEILSSMKEDDAVIYVRDDMDYCQSPTDL
jgi:hypothetical protein